MENTPRVRVRFAPSPTGPLHMGGVRTALYNYLFAKRHGGDFILRIEDTDSQRFVPGAEEYIVESLRWCGIEVDEGVGVGGPHAPYRQSERRGIYQQYARQLVDSGWAYYAFDTPASLDALRKEAEQAGRAFAYDHSVRESLETSLRLTPAEVDERIARGDQWVIRFRTPQGRDVAMDDIVRGAITVNTATLDDKVLFKSADMLPTYHLANVVDDHLMLISHVIRGEEWLPSLPLHYLLYEAFGWSDSRPRFAHLPLLLKPQGQGKLSKRDGDKFGFPVFPLQWASPEGETARGYREDGFLPGAFVNLLALLGWNPGTEQEIFDMQGLIDNFSLDRVGKAGARFNLEKARWFNAQYIKAASDAQMGEVLRKALADNGIDVTPERAAQAVAIIKERAVLTTDLLPLTSFMFVAPKEYDEKSVRKFWKADNVARLRLTRQFLADAGTVTVAATEPALQAWAAANEYPLGQVMNTLRLAVLGTGQGPSVVAICEFVGLGETLARIDSAIERLGEGA